jgi:subtilase family serine protease
MGERRRKGGVACAAACAIGLIAAVGTVSADARLNRSERVGPAPSRPAGAVTGGPLAPATRMRVTVALSPRDPAALSAFATAVSSPTSKLYGHYISPRQFGRRFGATSTAIDAVASWLRAHGLDPGAVSANHLSIPVAATAGELSRAFSLSLDRLRLRDRSTAVVSSAAPLLDADIAPLVQGVLGLDSVSSPRPLLEAAPTQARQPVSGENGAAWPRAEPRVATGGPQPCAAARFAAYLRGGYTLDEIAAAYGFTTLYRFGDEGAGETIAMYELEPDDPLDIASFQSCYGTRAAVAYVPVDGGAGRGPGSGEAALDIETEAALMPKAKLLVYQGPNSRGDSPGSGPYDTFSAIISQDRASVISVSWGNCELVEGLADARAEATLFQEAAAQGQTIVSAAGDQGSEDCLGSTRSGAHRLAVDDPAGQSWVTAVGGTTLTASGARFSEQVWNEGGPDGPLLGVAPGAGGGGVSSYWPMPQYQALAAPALHVIRRGSSRSACDSTSYCREVPDVSSDANPATGYLVYWNGSHAVNGPVGWRMIGGTSAGAPTWAAVIALANASHLCKSPIGFANPRLYAIAGTAYAAMFNDVTAGDNDFTATGGGKYQAAPGYDMASGLGTPRASAVAVGLCSRTGNYPPPPPPVGRPSLTGGSLTGLRSGRPELAFTLAAGRGAPPIAAINIAVTPGLWRAEHAGSVTVKGPKRRRLNVRQSVSHGALRLRLGREVRLASVTIAAPALRGVGKHVGKVVGVTVTVTDGDGVTTRLQLRLRAGA